MLAAVLAVAPPTATGLPAAMIVAAGVTALVALGFMLGALRRRQRLTIRAITASAGAALAVVGLAVGGVVAASPDPAQAAPEPANRYVVESGDPFDLQLPTLGLD